MFHETLALEVARAHRHRHTLAVCVLDVDDFRAANARLGQLAGDELLVEVADAHCARASVPTDLACRIGGDEFAVILPASSRIEAEGLFARVQATLRRRPLSPGPALSVSAASPSWSRTTTASRSTSAPSGRCSSAKEAGKGMAALADAA